MKIGEGRISKVNTLEALQRVLNYYISHNYDREQSCEPTRAPGNIQCGVPEYQYISQEDAVGEDLFISTRFSLQRLMEH